MRSQLDFSRSALLGRGLVLLGMGVTAGLIALGIPEEKLRSVHWIGLLGTDAVRVLLWVCGVGALATGLALLRRLAGDRVAAAIRHDGIELRGPFLSRYLPWRSVDRLYLHGWRFKGTTYHYIRLEGRRPRDASALHHFLAGRSFGLSVELLDASADEAAAWVAEADSAWRAICRPQPRAALPRAGFGRRAA